MKVPQQVLINELKEQTQDIINWADHALQSFSLDQLNWKAAPDRWSILECLEHLNLYGDFYIPAIRQAISKAPPVPQAHLFKSGWLGNYFAQSMLPKDGVVTNKMKTFSDKYPATSQLPLDVLHRFRHQQQTFLELLVKAEKVDCIKAKTGITVTQWIQLRLGDTFRFVIAHHLRHMVQVKEVIAAGNLRPQKQSSHH